jgi:hypothetical protein
VQYLVYKWIIQNKTIGEESCSLALLVVEIPCAETGDTRTQLRRKGQEQSEKGRD